MTINYFTITVYRKSRKRQDVTDYYFSLCSKGWEHQEELESQGKVEFEKINSLYPVGEFYSKIVWDITSDVDGHQKVKGLLDLEELKAKEDWWKERQKELSNIL